uniref:Secreted protein n=1 Tax=Brugia timori TaxID=42155 RepID=A0A0R3QIE9_9BILA
LQCTVVERFSFCKRRCCFLHQLSPASVSNRNRGSLVCRDSMGVWLVRIFGVFWNRDSLGQSGTILIAHMVYRCCTLLLRLWL